MKRTFISSLSFFLGISLLMTGCQSSKSNESFHLDDLEDDHQASALSLMEPYNSTTQNLEACGKSYYEIFLYSFYDSNNDGIGDLPGLIEKLDYINDGDPNTTTDLGFTGIWLMPIMPAQSYHKYDVTNYCDIDPEYGTLDDFKTLVDECHKRGIDLIIDLVMNHSSSEHPWFKEATTYLQSLPTNTDPDASVCPYVDYYQFSTEKKGGSFYSVENTNLFYEAPFWSGMPDLNLGNPAVRQEFEHIVDFWLNLGVDGFRLDAAKEYYSDNISANVEVLTWFNDYVKSQKADAYIVAEVWNNMEAYTKYYESGIDSCFNFDFAGSDGIIAKSVKHAGGNATSYGKGIEKFEAMAYAYGDHVIDAPFYTNHDMARSAGYYSGDFSPQQTKIAIAMNQMMSGYSFLYYGEELGMKGSGKDENKRAPMQWIKDKTASGMCTGPKDMDSIKMKYEPLEDQTIDGDSIFNYTKEVIKLRNTYPEISKGKTSVVLSDENLCVLNKQYEDQEMLIAFNISDTEISLPLDSLSTTAHSGSDLTISGLLLTSNESITVSDTEIKLPAYSIIFLK